MKNEERSKLLLEVIPRTMRMVRTEMRRLAGDEFTVPQYRVLSKLTRGPCSNGELADWMGVSAPTMSKMIDKLVKRGYVARKMEGSDRRQVVLTCTKKGTDRAQKIRGTVQNTFSERIALLSEDQRRELTAGLLVLKEFVQ